MKKICFITTIPNTLKGFVLEFAKYMHDNDDYDITFICDKNEEFGQELPEYIHYLPVEMSRGISIGGIKACLQMYKIFKKNKFDMIQFSTPNASLYASIAGWLAHVPVRLYCQWGLAFVGFSGLKQKIFIQEEKLVCKLSTWIEPDSQGNLDFCHKQKIYPFNKGSVVHKGSASGVSLDKFDVSQKDTFRKEIRKKWNVPYDAFVYGFVGSLTGDKGLNELLMASKEILESNEDIRVLLIGNFDKEYSIDKDLLSWSKTENRIIYCGSTSDVQKYMAAMDCYVMPSYREGFGLTVVEAGAMGLPVICTDIPGPTDAIKNGVNGIIIEKKNYSDLKEAILNLYNNRELCSELGRNGLKIVRENYEQKTLFKYILEDRNKLLNVHQELK